MSEDKLAKKDEEFKDQGLKDEKNLQIPIHTIGEFKQYKKYSKQELIEAMKEVIGWIDDAGVVWDKLVSKFKAFDVKETACGFGL